MNEDWGSKREKKNLESEEKIRRAFMNSSLFFFFFFFFWFVGFLEFACVISVCESVRFLNGRSQAEQLHQDF